MIDPGLNSRLIWLAHEKPRAMVALHLALGCNTRSCDVLCTVKLGSCHTSMQCLQDLDIGHEQLPLHGWALYCTIRSKLPANLRRVHRVRQFQVTVGTWLDCGESQAAH